MKKILLVFLFIYNISIYSQTFDGNLGSKSLKWNTDQKNFNSPPRMGVDPMSIKLWDNYNGANSTFNAPSDFGSLLEISGKEGHLISQLYFDSTWNGARILYRSAFYGQESWESWRYILDSRSDVVSSGNLKITGNGSSYVSGNLGIGTTNPQNKFQIGEFNNGGITKLSIPGIYNFEEVRLGQYGNGQSGFEMITHADATKSFGVRLYTGTDTGVNGLLIQTANPTTSLQNLNYTTKMVVNLNGDVGIGTTNPDSKLTVAGNIHAQEVKVTVNAGADFVFESDYNLPPLDSINKFIKENKHLPEIPSAEVMKKEGLNLSEMNIKLLQKMEEMTLYMIEQNKQIINLKNRLEKKLVQITSKNSIMLKERDLCLAFFIYQIFFYNVVFLLNPHLFS